MAEIVLTQLEAERLDQIVEWIEYDKFEDVEYLAKGGFGTTFKAVWKDGPILSCDNNQWRRESETKVALKCLYNSQGITADFLKEVKSNILVYCSGYTVRCFDPLKRPNARELYTLFYSLWYDCKKRDSVIYRQVEETDDNNKKLLSSMVQSPLSTTSNLLYTTHSQAVYTSKLLDFKNLPEPKNADNDDLEYSDSLKMDFTKLNINSKEEN
ncbi:kinase-like domain-containing protein [Rhizophagus irregularis DAOM 181602=DAOM 197198]|nr:kinase-like domain-containing protein [Rhizophagus irregularis DAOM 181602=DAOM 197198]